VSKLKMAQRSSVAAPAPSAGLHTDTQQTPMNAIAQWLRVTQSRCCLLYCLLSGLLCCLSLCLTSSTSPLSSSLSSAASGSSGSGSGTCRAGSGSGGRSRRACAAQGGDYIRGVIVGRHGSPVRTRIGCSQGRRTHRQQPREPLAHHVDVPEGIVAHHEVEARLELCRRGAA